MAHPTKFERTIGNRIAPPRFLLFVTVLVIATAVGWNQLGPTRAFMVGFDVAAASFLLALSPLLRAHSTSEMRAHADANDANRVVLLVIAVSVTLAILATVGSELAAKGHPNVPLVVATLALAWLYANTVYALHYAHMYYLEGSQGGLNFAGSPDNPDYNDFIYFAFTLGMTFQTSDTGVESRAMRRVVTYHCLAAFVFNIGVLAFSVNTLGGGASS